MEKSKTSIRQHVGIDMSKDSFVAAVALQHADLTVSIVSTKKFTNSAPGFESLLRWTKVFTSPELPFGFAMEATGVYYEPLCYWLFERGLPVSVQLAQKVKHYGQSLNIKTKTDRSDAAVIARMGLERKLKAWNAGSAALRQIKLVLREREALIEEVKGVKNQLHALSHAHQAPVPILERLKKRLDFMAQQLAEVEAGLTELVKADAPLKERVEHVCTIKGVGFISAITVIAETNGFALFGSQRQLVSYAGYDVVQNQSGSSLNGKTRISKKGNRRIRKALYFPAITASMYDARHKAIFGKIYQKTAIKMKGSVAIQRRLLILIYTLYKNNEPYDEHRLNQAARATTKIRQDQIETCPA
ncbi:IS110 family transposase [Dyadobacter flavalbus]|uniref:IS110 family transposase n=1 Tax=Dyadobacter flavalbus TaxID=2579942 RepID=A0A5M8QL78_9BACT|nr:IS110 family transposase [Dyadobacter flavalbus]KAA6436875.1 IS110 family transposase [Dyadobacter flavalbus]